jgi:hypothetical protein
VARVRGGRRQASLRAACCRLGSLLPCLAVCYGGFSSGERSLERRDMTRYGATDADICSRIAWRDISSKRLKIAGRTPPGALPGQSALSGDLADFHHRYISVGENRASQNPAASAAGVCSGRNRHLSTPACHANYLRSGKISGRTLRVKSWRNVAASAPLMKRA